MKVYHEELEAWSKFRQALDTTPLTQDQLQAIDQKARKLLKETSGYPELHNLLNLILILTLLGLDMLSFTLQGISGLIIMTLGHGFFIYSLTVFTMHEGAGHNRIIIGHPNLAFVVNNISRLFFADPFYYKQAHPSHHQLLGTKDDQAFTFLVLPKRIWKSFLPGAGVLPFNDYKIHNGDQWTPSKIISFIVGCSFSAVLCLIARPHHDVSLLLFIILIASPWIGFSLDRLRETSEHLLMKSDDIPEARELGNNFWGYLIGGGPWGQPCHLSHHIAPALPWYQQLRLSRTIRKVMTIDQRKNFFINQRFFGYPKKFVELVKINNQVFKNKV